MCPSLITNMNMEGLEHFEPEFAQLLNRQPAAEHRRQTEQGIQQIDPAVFGQISKPRPGFIMID